MRKKILFISHDASRTGAPIVLLNLLKWLNENSEIQTHILLKSGGPLVDEFRSIGKTYLWQTPAVKPTIIRRIINKILIPETHQQKTINQIKKEAYDLIYANSVASSSVVIEIKKHIDIPVLMHVHELSISISQFCGQKTFRKVIPSLDKIIGVSAAVINNLIKEYEIDKTKTELIYEFVPVFSRPKEDKGYLKNKLNISENAFIVGGSGTTDWRKGTDLFINTAKVLFKKNIEANIHFVWLGGYPNTIEFEKFLYDIKKYELISNVHFIGSQSNSLDYFQDFDCFFLSSREDPYPLVCLENAALGKPILCFEGSGGMPEFVEEEAGIIVEYGNTTKMADAILKLYNDIELKTKLGNNAKRKVIERHDVSKTGMSILNLIKILSNNA